ncbi:SDR family oxidoreductase [Lutibacter sp.]|uniref:SDR family NAD(P)-dependent oxidoreductase n=1 Tax=Lutibacter sp. TaxID=1925666 RepID=UPI0027327911|nr:SDR family oxidoreductase [Lutibacter sp.]MDP3313032.1 SDR family oxidoreductase [Lutibacter sp.]
MKNVIITGSSKGIGFEMVQLFAKNKCNVLALSRNNSSIKSLSLSNVNALDIDLTNETDLTKVQEFVALNWKSIDIIIHNAGKLIKKPFSELTSIDFLEVYQVNVFSIAELTRILLPHLKKGSHVVNISSIGGIQGSVKFPGLAAYSSSKGALITLTEMLAEEYKEQQISFNVLALGAVQTEMLEEAFPGYKAPVTAFEMADYIYQFALTGNQLFNGKVLQVSSSTP